MPPATDSSGTVAGPGFGLWTRGDVALQAARLVGRDLETTVTFRAQVAMVSRPSPWGLGHLNQRRVGHLKQRRCRPKGQPTVWRVEAGYYSCVRATSSIVSAGWVS